MKVILIILMVSVSFVSKSQFKITVAEPPKSLMTVYKDSIVITDTIASIKYLIKMIAEKDSIIESAKKRLKLATDVLKNVTTSGFVYNENRVAFNKSAKKYFEFYGYKYKQSMPLLDILTRKPDGTAAGWIKQ